MSVRPPGYYCSWYHFIHDLPASQNINLYDFIVKNSFWNNKGKKLNAIITVPEGVTISANSIPTSLNNLPVTVPALTIGNEFRYYDRITFINKGIILGAFGSRSYSGTGDFIPPVNFTPSSYTPITLHRVTRASLQAHAGGGRGGNGTGHNAGAGGGGGGGGGYCKQTVSITPGSQVSRHDGGAGSDASWKQGATTLIKANQGVDGQPGNGGGRHTHWDMFHSWKHNDGGIGGTGGAGGNGCQGSSGYSLKGTAGGKGTGGTHNDRGGTGGAGGSGGFEAGHGGRGGDFNNTSGRTGTDGFHNWDYTRIELYGPAVNIKHNNVFFTNAGEILGGTTLNGSGKDVYAFYGKNLLKSLILGKIYSATSESSY